MLGEEAAAIGAHAPETSPEDKLAKDIKKVIAEESAKIRHTSMTEAKLKAEQFHTEHTLTWMPPEELENEVISAFVKAFRYDAIAKGTEGMTSWDTDRYYTSETIGIMPSQKENVDDLISKIRLQQLQLCFIIRPLEFTMINPFFILKAQFDHSK